MLQGMLGHWNWNQAVPHHAPQPQSPEASEVNSIDARKHGGKTLTAIQADINVRHHHTSAEKLRLRRM